MKSKEDVLLKKIKPFIIDKDVLDIGCVEHSLNNKNKERIWVHDFLKRNCRTLTGIDILKKDVQILRKEGYEVCVMNAETFSFKKKFEIIFAGELIEHLSNPGLFLQQCKKHLEKKGILILTTPNAFNFYRLVLSFLRGNNNPPVNNEHVCWYSPKVLKTLLERYNLEIFKTEYVDYPFLSPRMDVHISNFFSKFFPKLKETMILFIRIKNEN